MSMLLTQNLLQKSYEEERLNNNSPEMLWTPSLVVDLYDVYVSKLTSEFIRRLRLWFEYLCHLST